jgi:hypothetical protein
LSTSFYALNYYSLIRGAKLGRKDITTVLVF